jgi:hypothetical protein
MVTIHPIKATDSQIVSYEHYDYKAIISQIYSFSTAKGSWKI